jgi:gamma-glutamylcyclotransferase
MGWIHYFAYGSNMLRARLRARVPSAVAVTVARLDGRRLDFGKRGRDGSGKCDVPVVSGAGAEAWGVVYALRRAELAQLDRIEGAPEHYVRDRVEVCIDGAGHRVEAYLARRRGHGLLPFDWYHRVVLAGARQHALPVHYVEWLAVQPCYPDPDASRPVRLEVEAALAACGEADAPVSRSAGEPR